MTERQLDDLNAVVGRNVREYRRAVGMTIAGLANEVGISGTVLMKIEQGQRPALAKEIYLIARVLGRSLEELFLPD